MEENSSEEVSFKTMYEKPYSPLVETFEVGDVMYLHYYGEYGHNRKHMVVTDVGPLPNDRFEVVAVGRYGGEFTLKTEGDSVTLTSDTEYETIDEKSIYHIERVPREVVEDADWRQWEVHLCVSQMNESSDDQVFLTEAGDWEQAVAFSKRRADRDLPEVGPVYDEGEPPKIMVE